MAFCQNCGEELAYGAKFCPECGTPAGNTGSENIRKQEFAGEIKKCPSCGSEIPAFTSHCPNCGHEFSETKVDNSVKEFFEKLSAYSDGYETDIDKEKGNNYAGIKYFICFIAVCIMGGSIMTRVEDEGFDFICFLLAILLIAAFMVAFLMKRPMTQADKQKKNLIETFIVPNNKEAIIEFLILSASQIQPRGNPFTKEGQENNRWTSIWKTKIRQTITKSKLVLMNDKDAQEKIAMIKSQYGIR